MCAVSRKVQRVISVHCCVQMCCRLWHNHEQERFLNTADKILQVLGHRLGAAGWQCLAAVSGPQGIWLGGCVLRGTAVTRWCESSGHTTPESVHWLQKYMIANVNTVQRSSWVYFHISLQNTCKVRDCLHPVTKPGCVFSYGSLVCYSNEGIHPSSWGKLTATSAARAARHNRCRSWRGTVRHVPQSRSWTCPQGIDWIHKPVLLLMLCYSGPWLSPVA